MTRRLDPSSERAPRAYQALQSSGLPARQSPSPYVSHGLGGKVFPLALPQERSINVWRRDSLKHGSDHEPAWCRFRACLASCGPSYEFLFRCVPNASVLLPLLVHPEGLLDRIVPSSAIAPSGVAPLSSALRIAVSEIPSPDGVSLHGISPMHHFCYPSCGRSLRHPCDMARRSPPAQQQCDIPPGCSHHVAVL